MDNPTTDVVLNIENCDAEAWNRFQQEAKELPKVANELLNTITSVYLNAYRIAMRKLVLAQTSIIQAVRGLVTYRMARARAYHSPRRSSSAATHKDGSSGESDSSDQADPPLRCYYHFLTIPKPYLNNSPLAVVFPQQMSRVLLERRRAA